ncbi:MAG: YceI family protein [Cyclobacteriaceae bacterium]
MKILVTALLLSGLVLGNKTIEVDAEKSKVGIQGTSSLHDWESTVESFSINGNIGSDQISDLVASFKVESIKSGKSIMDSKTQDALKADKHPNIVFKAAALKIENGIVKGSGTLTIAGNSKPFQFNANTKELTTGGLLIAGSTKLKMSDFGIDPPTAMFGTLTTGDEVTVNYEIIINQ